MNKLYVITGGPGVGKTTLLNALAADGVTIVTEVARAIIKEQLAAGGDALPWKNKARYTDLMLVASIRDYKRAVERQPKGIHFFDRSVVDAICYAEMIGYSISPSVVKEASACQYHPTIFILPPWREIYETDTERKQTWEEATYTYGQLKIVYQRYGYEIIDVPKGSVEKRKKFVNEIISSD
ncbi:MAG TPA: AAA family ATPase [Parapedobacter sp.]|uniref:AAA family ATPase n=1 Tax=Parapedobacter sp. TaxID=1958893 RepID=UPI002CB248F2|nr:AAA family ATPase [Parapedobacter sp.]HWK57229.1 AAA family ATPase [Parapedobacter sp.]